MRQLNTTAVAAQIGCDPSTIRRLAAQHGVGQKIGRDWIFTAGDVDKLRRIHAANAVPTSEEMARRGAAGARKRWRRGK